MATSLRKSSACEVSQSTVLRGSPNPTDFLLSAQWPAPDQHVEHPRSVGRAPEPRRRPGDLDDGSRRSAIVFGRGVTPPAIPYFQSASRPTARLAVQLDQLPRGAFDNIAVVHDRMA